MWTVSDVLGILIEIGSIAGLMVIAGMCIVWVVQKLESKW